MTKPTIAEEAKRKSRGWSDAMDSASIAQRLEILDELYACWKSLNNARKVSPPLPEGSDWKSRQIHSP